jgi:outer membrane protein TolC
MLARRLSLRSTATPRRFAAWRALSLLTLSAALSMVVGCASYDTYKKTAGNNTSEIDALTADAENPVPEIHPAAYSAAPITSKSLRDGQEIQYRDVTVGEVLRIALENSEVLRELGGTILRTPETIRTRYTTGLQQTDPRFGTHAALSAFDAQFKGSAMVNENDRIYNNSFFAGGINGYIQDLYEYKSELSKRAATGALMIFRNVSDMDANNAPGNLFGHAWNFYTEAEARQPLLQGGGLQYNRIAGPAGAPGLYNGILIARVNVDVTQTDFEIAVRDYVSNVVNTYWDLYYAYRDLDARRRAMHAALESWRKIKAQVEAEGLSASKEAQAREQYYRFKQEVDDSLSGRLLQGTQTRNGSTGGTLRANSGVQVNERRLRYMIGLPITDGTLLRPSQDPDEAEVIYDWEILMQESLARRPELRRQQLKVKRREMELLAAQNFIIPQLDVVGRYRFRGFGNELIEHSGIQSGGKPSSAIGNLATFEHQEWMAGVEFSMPIGFRQGHAAVANAEIALCHERAIHREQEREIIHDLSNALSDAVRAFESCQSSLNRYIASREVLLSLEAEEKNGLPIDIDRILDAQRRVVEAEIRYYQSRTEYAIAQKNVQLERGALAGENDLWLIDGIDSSASGQQPITLPSKVPPAPAPAPEVEEAKPMPQANDAKRIPEGDTAKKKTMANSLMQQARQDLAKGDIAAARDKAEQAADIDVAYSVFDERPEQLLTEIERRANNVDEDSPSTQSLTRSPKPTKPVAAKSAELPSSVNNDKQLAQHLLNQAQVAASQGDHEHARSLALEANELNVAYDLFDLRPEQVLAQVEAASNNNTIVKGNSKAKPGAKVSLGITPPGDKAKPAARRFPATNKVQATSGKKDMLPTLELDDSPNEASKNGVIFVPAAPESEESMSQPAVDEVSAMPPQRNFSDALLVPSASDDDDDEDEMSDEFWDK